MVSRAAALIGERAAAPRAEEYLGPARVLDASALDAEVELPSGGVVRAELALALPYEPAAGDVLLVIGRESAFYVIGVLKGAGKTALTFQGDVDVHAAGGSLRLSADKGVEIKAPEIEMNAGKLRVAADAVVHKFTSLTQRVRSLFSLHAGKTHTVVDESSFAQSKSAAILTEETMTINGKQIHLG